MLPEQFGDARLARSQRQAPPEALRRQRSIASTPARAGEGAPGWGPDFTCDGQSAMKSTARAFRLSPASVARLIAVPRTASRYAASSTARMYAASVRASLPASTARGANVGSRTGFANETFHGHTSWEVCRLRGIAIPPLGGRYERALVPTRTRLTTAQQLARWIWADRVSVETSGLHDQRDVIPR